MATAGRQGLRVPPGRYGPERRRPAWLSPMLAAVAIAAVVAAIWAWSAARERTGIRSSVLAFAVESDTLVRVDFAVVTTPERVVTCLVRARARDGAEVGRAEVEVGARPDGERRRTASYDLPTTREAVTGEVAGCRPGGVR